MVCQKPFRISDVTPRRSRRELIVRDHTDTPCTLYYTMTTADAFGRKRLIDAILQQQKI